MAEIPFLQIFQQVAKRFNLDPALLIGVAKQESRFNPNAVSTAGAQGVMQLMPATAKSLGVDDPFDPVQNIVGGAAYLREQIDRFGDVETALAAYNAGPGRVQKAGGDLTKLPKETRNYVPAVMGFYSDYGGIINAGTPQQPVKPQPQRIGPATPDSMDASQPERLGRVSPQQRLSPVDSTSQSGERPQERLGPAETLQDRLQPQRPGPRSMDPRQFFSDLTAARGQPGMRPTSTDIMAGRERRMDRGDATLGEILGEGFGFTDESKSVEQSIAEHPKRSGDFPVPSRSDKSARLREEIIRRITERRQRLRQGLGQVGGRAR